MLDPERIGLNAASVGYMERRGEKVDYASFKRQLQTDDGGCVKVRREAETPVNEVHVMGGELKGLESNSNLLDRSRQARQMAGYPLRSFSADAPAIILPAKYGGLPMYTRKQTEYQDYVSRFTEPMSAPLQRDTELLGHMGYSASNESASNPYRSLGFEMNLHKPQSAINMNEAMIRQRKFLEASSRTGQSQKHNLMSVGVFVSANGDPITEVEDAIDSDRATLNAFQLHQSKQQSLMMREGRFGAANARVDPRQGLGMVKAHAGNVGRVVGNIPMNYSIATPMVPATVKGALPFATFAPVATPLNLFGAMGSAATYVTPPVMVPVAKASAQKMKKGAWKTAHNISTKNLSNDQKTAWKNYKHS